MSRKKVGLALGSGAVRELVHIGALYADGKDTEQIKDLVLDINWWRLAPLVDLTLP